jgi:hypothetical protein
MPCYNVFTVLTHIGDMMLITRVSPISGKEHTLELNVVPQQIAAWMKGMYAQRAMPYISPAEREFVMTGITPEEWQEAYGDPVN